MRKNKQKRRKEQEETEGLVLINALAEFERQARTPVVVSLLVERGGVSFVSCVSKKHFDVDSDGDEGRSERLERLKLSDASKPKLKATQPPRYVG